MANFKPKTLKIILLFLSCDLFLSNVIIFFCWRNRTWEPQITVDVKIEKGFNVKEGKKLHQIFSSSFQPKKTTLLHSDLHLTIERTQPTTQKKNLGKIISFFERPYVAAFFQYSKRTMVVWNISVGWFLCRCP